VTRSSAEDIPGHPLADPGLEGEAGLDGERVEHRVVKLARFARVADPHPEKARATGR
jgi:hypothetical protein